MAKKHHPKNEQMKWEYLHFLEHSKRRAPETVDQAAAAIAAFEASANWKDFGLFHVQQAIKFKRDLEDHIVKETGKPLAAATRVSRLRAVQEFFRWLCQQKGYKGKLTYTDFEYFNPSGNEGRIAGAVREKPVPSLEQIRYVLSVMPVETVIQRRNRALIAFTILSGARDAAIASMCLRHVNLEGRTVFQDAREVKTKNRKTFTSFYFPVGEDIERIVADWIGELTTTHLFGPSDPLFPATARTLDANHHFQADGIARHGWSGAGPIRRIFKDAFAAAGLPYFNPHSFRNTLMRLGAKASANGMDARAWSLNLGHNSVLTSFASYGTLSLAEREEVMANLAKRINPPSHSGQTPHDPPDPATIAKVLAHLQQQAT